MTSGRGHVKAQYRLGVAPIWLYVSGRLRELGLVAKTPHVGGGQQLSGADHFERDEAVWTLQSAFCGSAAPNMAGWSGRGLAKHRVKGQRETYL